LPSRIKHFDALRGLAIIAVVAIHSTGSGLKFNFNDFNFHFTIFFRNLLNFAVPMFLAISGFFLLNKKNDTLLDHKLFLQRQIPKVLIPCYFWSFCFFVLLVYVTGKSVKVEFVKLITFQTVVPYYFIALITQYYIALPFIKKLVSNAGLAISVVISIFSTIIIFYIRYYTDIQLLTIVYGGCIFTWIMFFVLGMYLKKFEHLNIPNNILVLLIIIFYALSCVESYLLILKYNQPADAVTAVKPSSFLFSFFLIIYLFKNFKLSNNNILIKLGKASFGIYLIHVYALKFISKLQYDFFNQLENISIFKFSFLIIFTLLLSYCAIKFTNKFVSNNKSRYIGFS
jgi:surface polysaccharide O-acyltransferase-like enzyme